MGAPGARFHLRDGDMIAAEGPGSPGVEAFVLAASAEGESTTELRDGVSLRFVEAADAARKVIDTAELQALARESVFDAAFSAVIGEVDRYVVDGALDEFLAALLSAVDGVSVDDLLAETAHRLDEFASLPVVMSPYRERVVSVAGVDAHELSVRRQQIHAHADGRRSARDIAFALGRSAYATTVEVSHMLGEGLLEIATVTSISPSEWGFASVRLRSARQTPATSVDGEVGSPPRRPTRAAE